MAVSEGRTRERKGAELTPLLSPTEYRWAQGNAAYRRGDFEMAISLYEAAHGLESELPHYQLNLAAAHLKLNKYVIPYLLSANLCAYPNPQAGWRLRKPVRRC